MRILYRMRQFWRTIFVKIDPAELEKVQEILNPAQAEIFQQLQPGERQHAMLMVRKLVEQGDDQPELLVAALLHDVGKRRYRQNPFERSMVVLVKALKPEWARKWGDLPSGRWTSLPGWRRPFVLAERHAEWGAELARKVGVSPLTETLIRLHHQPHVDGESEAVNAMLHRLWEADNES